jgi:site-specific DNA recombinase
MRSAAAARDGSWQVAGRRVQGELMLTATADLYLRLSIDFEGATAIERQEVDCRRWCATHAVEVRRVHVDRGVSGYSRLVHRDGFDAASRAVIVGEVSTLVVWKLDRLSRRGIGQIGGLLDEFERVGGRLVSVQDQLDTAQPQARMIIALLSEFARAESEVMGLRVRSAKEAQRAAGLWLSGKPPFGYAVAADQRLVPVEPAASLMRHVFRLIATGHSLTMVCHHLNSSGLRNSRGNPWTTSCLSEAIRTPAYAGMQPARHVAADGRRLPGKPEVYRDRDTGLEVSCLSRGAKPIISRAEQLAIFEVLAQRREWLGRGSRPRRPAHALLLRGFGRCAACDRPLVTHGAYKCRRFDTTGALVCTQPTSANVHSVDLHVTNRWMELVSSSEPDAELRRQVMLRWSPVPRRPTGWRRLDGQLADLRARVADADDAFYVRADLDAVRHARVMRSLARHVAETEAKLAEIEPVIDTGALSDPEFVARQWSNEAPDGRRALLRLAWSKILVAKASSRGGWFDPARISYLPLTSAAASVEM